jgi:Ku protein
MKRYPHQQATRFLRLTPATPPFRALSSVHRLAVSLRNQPKDVLSYVVLLFELLVGRRVVSEQFVGFHAGPFPTASQLANPVQKLVAFMFSHPGAKAKISLVSFGVQLYVATEAKSQISFNQISRSTGERIRHQKVLQSAIENSGADAATAVQKDEIVKGYEYRKGEYIIVENSELENLRVPSKHTIDVTQFVNLNELNPEFVEKPYFLVPENDSVEAFAVVRKALQKTGKVAIGKIAFSGREHVLAISAAGDGDRGGMMAYTLRYTSELRNQSDYFRDIKPVEIGEESLELAESLIAKRSAKWTRCAKVWAVLRLLPAALGRSRLPV